jgi:hypothetical protein
MVFSYPMGGRKVKSQAAATGMHCRMRDRTDPMVNKTRTTLEQDLLVTSFGEKTVSRTDDNIEDPAPSTAMVCKAKQKACNGYLHGTVRDDYQPCVPPSDLEEFGCILGFNENEVFCVMTDPKPADEVYDNSKIRRAQRLKCETVSFANHRRFGDA